MDYIEFTDGPGFREVNDMVIKVEENPEGFRGINKFIAKNGEGHRGKIIAIHSNKKEAIVLAMNSSCKKHDGVVWGKLYLIREDSSEEWPRVVKGANSIPNTKNWEIL